MGNESGRKVPHETFKADRLLQIAISENGATAGDVMDSPLQTYGKESSAKHELGRLTSAGLLTSDDGRPERFSITKVGIEELKKEAEALRFMADYGEEQLRKLRGEEE